MNQAFLMLQFSRKIALRSPAQFNRVKGLVVLYLIVAFISQIVTRLLPQHCLSHRIRAPFLCLMYTILSMAP